MAKRKSQRITLTAMLISDRREYGENYYTFAVGNIREGNWYEWRTQVSRQDLIEGHTYEIKATVKGRAMKRTMVSRVTVVRELPALEIGA
ncbi:hypothetical protein [Risungbinella massiliensis]|uniref:hypothetical protein n=1 Tax=Risungbinella massiliensis TaxID=1329796 RepID=UPI0005CC7323|nr:hypothetical protein [Risungbinella massiliensis]